MIAVNTHCHRPREHIIVTSFEIDKSVEILDVPCSSTVENDYEYRSEIILYL